MIRRKQAAACLTAGILIPLGITLLLRWNMGSVRPFRETDAVETGGDIRCSIDDAQYVYEVQDTDVDGRFYYMDRGYTNLDDRAFFISGWAVVPGESAKTFDIRVVLENPADRSLIQLKTVLRRRTDLAEALKAPEGVSYELNGFYATAFTKYIDKTVPYRIYIYYGNDAHHELTDTGAVLSLA